MTQGFTAFAAEMYAPGGKGMDRLRDASEAPDWPARRDALLADSGVDRCDRTYMPTERCVLEELLVELGREGGPEAIVRLVKIAEDHPQRELRIRALHGLLAAGPAGHAAAAGTPGAPSIDDDAVARTVRARAVLLRGDGPEHAIGTPLPWRHALLEALARGFSDRGAHRLESARLLAAGGPWLAFVIDALFDPQLAKAAQFVLGNVPAERWKPLVAARKKVDKTPLAKAPSATQKKALDAELAVMRAELEAIVLTLRKERFAFVAEPLRPPPKGFAAKLRKLERRIGRVPLALARFWAVVGDVDLRGNHPAWKKKTYVAGGGDPHWLADPLVVTSLDGALADAEDGDFDAREAPSSLRYALDLAGDDVTKANFSGGIVSVATPSSAIDPPLTGRAGTFLEMLRDAIAWGGFPGFATIDDAPIRRRTG